MAQMRPHRSIEIVHVITGLGVGGAEAMLASLVAEKQLRGVPQHVISLTTGGPHAAALRAIGVTVDELDFRSMTPPFLQIARLARLIAAASPALLQSWMYHADIAATVALALSGRRRSTRLVWGIRCSDLDLRRYSPLLRLAVRLSARLSPLADAIVANSRAGLAAHLDLGYRPRRAHVIHNGIDVDRFRPDASARAAMRAELAIAEGRCAAICVARLDPMKDHGLLLAAATRLPGITFILVGAGTETLPVPPNVRALGRRLDVPSLLQAADVVVSTSAFGEGFSNALAEGMASGLVPLATDVGDSAAIVGPAGRIVPARDREALTAAITALADEPPDARAARAAAARSRIVEHFSLARAVEAFDRLHAELIEQAPR
ncbi:MAG: glycosyltransferase [Alphaproteobacteria bacterium]|nr:glycosyltransferase [Alphaproteobacteria bacterium]